MELNKLTPNLMVDDVNKTVGFYKDVLGFEFVMAVPKDSQEVLMEMPKDKQLIYALMKSGDVQLMFQAKDSLSEDIPVFKDRGIGASLTLYIEVDNVKELSEALEEKVEIVKELHTTFYGMQEFYIKDCNGYVLGFAESL
ncbi:Uncharacterized conserved protein PhnB, glyoxalase superfamily [Methanococcoides vulcani]|uniref:Uncharacterized conserved protein PhnB, glyoxalase superfamily n=1 Tax=Methanococcoides vulcani TaxID=1353158 RepID=A0A1I0BNE5_9EURY|nr:VOC family protein [Methanococcoides vulcani]SET08392.1 Uncharacterized conserved protein PhnB, glyoxalase superfamily [Methanococcoides vulcani]